LAFHYKPEGRPAFVAPIYPGLVEEGTVPADAPPLFGVVASDDGFKLVPQSIKLYQDWTAAGKTAELHIYAKGGHGFGAKPHGIPTDHWIDRFAEWLELEGFLGK
jgi:acetyl esterase/lipase